MKRWGFNKEKEISKTEIDVWPHITKRSTKETTLSTAPSRNHTKELTPNGTKQEPTTFIDSTNKFILNIKTKIGKKLTNGKLSAKVCLMKQLLLTKEHKLKERIIIFKSENRY